MKRFTDASEVIPICVMERAIEGINFAEQCDQGSATQRELRQALKRVIEWYKAPVYRDEVKACVEMGILPDGQIKTNREFIIAALKGEFDDNGATEECAVHYHIQCPYYTSKGHPCENEETNRDMCSECKMEWLDAPAEM